MEIANFFWDGKMSELEKNCIRSFYNNGFKVKLWSYDNIELENVESCDANLVLPRDFKLNQELNGKSENNALLACFSDYFRYKVVSLFGGWWFDTDCFCLKSSEEFSLIKEGRKIISCKQNEDINSHHHIGCGAFWMNEVVSKKLILEFEEMIKDLNGDVKTFGFFGPEFFTNFVKKHNLYNDILPIKSFYAIHWDKTDLIIYPENAHIAIDMTKDSLLTHIYTIHFEKNNVDKNNPIEGSFLDILYKK